VATDQVDCGDLLVLYTDGMLARPGRTPAASTVELGQLAVDAAAEPDQSVWSGPADRVCERTLELTTGRSGYSDDIAVLAAEVTEAASPVHLDLSADGDAVTVVIDALAEWLESMRVRDLDHIVVSHAVDELVTNIVEHAYSPGPDAVGPGRLTVDAELLPTGDVQIRFADTGRWRPQSGGTSRGRGLAIVRGMVDRLLVRGAETGTVATVRHRLSRPARMLTGETTPAGRREDDAASEDGFELTTQDARLHLAGPLDAGNLDDLRGAMAEALEPERVVLDLARVTRVPSAAVQALHLARQGAADRGQELVLYAPAGTTAQHVLELVRLPYVLTDPAGSHEREF
jgi:anti-sigma regulatory factor (Ser/Thr protein kinase)/anti-anti-sigma regulatory factor